jgi:hypothetical protein
MLMTHVSLVKEIADLCCENNNVFFTPYKDVNKGRNWNLCAIRESGGPCLALSFGIYAVCVVFTLGVLQTSQ